MKILKSEKKLKLDLPTIAQITKKKIEQAKEQTRQEIEEEKLVEAYPANFDMEYFKSLGSFKAREQYCNANLTRIAAGSSRIAYKIDDQKVLKLAKNVKGIAQNEAEGDDSLQGYYSEVITKLFDADEEFLWVEMEYADKLHPAKFEQIIGVPFRVYSDWMMHQIEMNKHPKQRSSYIPEVSEEVNEQLWANEFTMEIITFVMDTFRGNGDLTKINSYGLVRRDGEEKVVLVDYGATNPIMKQHYGMKEEENVETAYTKVYYGDKLPVLKRMVKNFTVIIPSKDLQAKEGVNLGVSTFVDKEVALNHSKQHGCDYVIPLYISPEASIYKMDSQGEGLRAALSTEDIKHFIGEGYDAIMDVNNRLNTEVIILKSDKVFTELELNKK